jgi:hypothetical protein
MDTEGRARSSMGERHGHNVVAANYGLERDTTLTTAPGGTYPADRLSCISCHDPHGRYRAGESGAPSGTSKPIQSSGSYGAQPTETAGVGTYRLLAGQAYAPKSLGAVPAFPTSAPVAVAPQTFNKSEASTQVRVAYGAGMSEWCANCHGALHTPYQTYTTNSFLHPSGASAKLNQNNAARIYNLYVKNGDLTGTQLTSYWSLVPYEEGTTDTVTLVARARSDGSAVDGPLTGAENVMCLSCHRAHASGWEHGMRWNQETEFVVAGGQWPGIDAAGSAANPLVAQGRMVADTRAAMYDREPSTFGTFQNSLCNKCHGK